MVGFSIGYLFFAVGANHIVDVPARANGPDVSSRLHTLSPARSAIHAFRSDALHAIRLAEICTAFGNAPLRRSAQTVPLESGTRARTCVHDRSRELSLTELFSGIRFLSSELCSRSEHRNGRLREYNNPSPPWRLGERDEASACSTTLEP